MKVKVIAVKRIKRTDPGGELWVSPKQAKALVMLKRARYAEDRYAEEPAKQPAAPRGSEKAPRRRRGTPTGEAVGAVTRAEAAGVASAPPAAEAETKSDDTGTVE